MVKLTEETIRERIADKLTDDLGISLNTATKEDIYTSVIFSIREILEEKWGEFSYKVNKNRMKRVYYLCMEFLVGPSLRNNLYNLNLEEQYARVLKEMGYDLEEFYSMEPDPGLGNGGLGRLAACYMDSLTTLNYPATGYSLLYEYGIFKQKIVEGWQTEILDAWMAAGDSWLVPSVEQSVEVKFDGELLEDWSGGKLAVEHKNYKSVYAVPYNMYISGKDGKGVNVLQLWKSKAPEDFDMTSFLKGDYLKAMEQNSMAEVISKVLYPADHHPEGKSLRLRQQYFLVSASIQTIVKRHLARYHVLDSLPQYAAIHINDTHPALAIPELMRILIDEHDYSWERAWKIVTETIFYTNHTVLSEALETWPEEIFKARLPRIHSIVCEINRRFCEEAFHAISGNFDAVSRMAVTAYGQIRMANLCLAGAKKINGVSALHSRIITETIFHDYYSIHPEKFTNVTNGIAHRRWLCQANPGLTRLIAGAIGDGFVRDPEELEKLNRYSEDPVFLAALAEVKHSNKARLADHIRKTTGLLLDTDSIFDVHIKRMHEYKRQHLNAMHILYLYQRMKEDKDFRDSAHPRTFIFGAKAAPGYMMAKQIIRFICQLANVINNDPDIQDKIKVVFMEDYKVSLAEIIIPAAEISQQISQAGKEASGTGNMKLMINGAVTLGTYDGANVEIHEAVGDENIFIFGLRDYEIADLWKAGYDPADYYNKDRRLKKVLDAMTHCIGGICFDELAQQIKTGHDPYMVAADFASYCYVSEIAVETYRDHKTWNRMALKNIAEAGRFAADRSIKEYAEGIWNAEPLL